MADTMGAADIRGYNVSPLIQGYVAERYKMKQICSIIPSSSWREDYYQEGSDTLTGGTGANVQGVPRGAEFPYLEPNWTLQQSHHVKHAGTSFVFYEDSLANAFDIVRRTVMRVGDAITYSVDRAIYSAITSDGNVNTAAAAATWDNATVADRDPVGDILRGIEELMIDNYDMVTERGYLLLSPTDYAHLMMNSKVINNPSFKTADVVSNGVVGQIAGLKIIVSNAVDADEAAIVVGQLAVNYLVLDSLKTALTYHAGKKTQVDAWEIGMVQIVHPEAIHIITNTQS